MNHQPPPVPLLGQTQTLSIGLSRVLPADVFEFVLIHGTTRNADVAGWTIAPPDGPGWMLVDWRLTTEGTTVCLWARPKGARL
jgi:hypothetical protein